MMMMMALVLLMVVSADENQNYLREGVGEQHASRSQDALELADMQSVRWIWDHPNLAILFVRFLNTLAC